MKYKAESKTKQNETKDEPTIHPSAPKQTGKNETNTKTKRKITKRDSVLNKYMQRRRICHLSTLTVSPI